MILDEDNDRKKETDVIYQEWFLSGKTVLSRSAIYSDISPIPDSLGYNFVHSHSAQTLDYDKGIKTKLKSNFFFLWWYKL